MTGPADRDGMFTDLRIGGNGSVVTCTWCGCLVADIEVHRQMHRDLADLSLDVANNE